MITGPAHTPTWTACRSGRSRPSRPRREVLALSGLLVVLLLQACTSGASTSSPGASDRGRPPEAVGSGHVPDPSLTSPIDSGLRSQPVTDTVSTFVGLWVTQDGTIRQRLLPDGRYVEARGTDESAYTGRYEITGDHIEYWDDSGFTADGDFRDDVLHHGGMVMRRAAG